MAALRKFHRTKNLKSGNKKLSYSTESYLINKFLQNGNLQQQQRKSSILIKNKNIGKIESSLAPSSSVRSISAETNIPKTTVRRILKSDLKLSIILKRLWHGVDLLRSIELDPSFLMKV